MRLPLLIDEIERLGGKVVVRSAAVDDLEDLARDHDLVVVSTGRGGLASLFPVDADRSPYAAPQRVAALTYLRGVTPDPSVPALRYHSVEGVGECFTCPALTVDGPCDIVVVEGVPGGPLDCWDDVTTPARAPGPAAGRCSPRTSRGGDRGPRTPTLVDDRSVLRGRITPVVRRPVGTLPERRRRARDGRRGGAQRPADQPGLEQRDQVGVVLPRGDQRARRARSTRAWMQRTFDNFWRGWAQWATAVDELLAAAGHRRTSGRSIDAADRAPERRRAGRGRLRRRAAVQPLVVRRRRRRAPSSPPQTAPSRRGSTPATCAGRWASTPPASPSSPPSTTSGEPLRR